MQQNRNLFVAIGVLTGVLMLLVAISLMFRSSGATKVDETKITPIPRLRSDTELPPLDPNQQRRLNEINRIRNKLSSIPASDQDRLNRLKNKLPVSTSDFEMDYSLGTSQFFIARKSADADNRIQDFLRENEVADFRSKYPELFIVTPQPVSEEILKAEEPIAADEERIEVALPEGPEAQEGEEPPLQTRDVQLLSDLLKTLVSFDLGGVGGGTQPPGGQEGLPSEKNLLIVSWAQKIVPFLTKGSNNLYSRLTGFPTDQIKPSSTCLGKYWCTCLVMDSFRLAGVKVPITHAVRAMFSTMSSDTSSYYMIDPTNRDSLRQLKPGCAIY